MSVFSNAIKSFLEEYFSNIGSVGGVDIKSMRFVRVDKIQGEPVETKIYSQKEFEVSATGNVGILGKHANGSRTETLWFLAELAARFDSDEEMFVIQCNKMVARRA